jgi:hypothetical protein
VKDQSVTVALPSGATKQFKMADVSYAGPFSAAPQPGASSQPPAVPVPPPAAPPPAATPPAAAAPRVHWEAAEPLTVSVMTSSADASFANVWGGSSAVLHLDHYDRLCTTPCDAPLPKGQYRFAITKDSKTIPTPAEVPVQPGDSVKAEYTSFQTMRTTGIVIAVVGGIGGFGYALASISAPNCDLESDDFSSCEDNARSDQETKIAIGSVIGGVSILVGMLLALKHDEAAVQVTPGVASTASPGAVISDGRRSAFGSYSPDGLTLSARF